MYPQLLVRIYPLLLVLHWLGWAITNELLKQNWYCKITHRISPQNLGSTFTAAFDNEALNPLKTSFSFLGSTLYSQFMSHYTLVTLTSVLINQSHTARTSLWNLPQNLDSALLHKVFYHLVYRQHFPIQQQQIMALTDQYRVYDQSHCA